ncbi:TIM barrel protein [Granulicella sp. 5B5]|nr:TIM barrel protein [Granulicella sp. 5B5]
MLTRRGFVKGAGLGLLGCTVARQRAFASPWGRPVGLQLYSVRAQLAKDYAGTLKQVGAIGYREVEAAGFYGHTPAQVKQAMADAQLKCVGGHYSYKDLAPNVDKIIAYHQELGCHYVICSFPSFRDVARVQGLSFAQQVRAFTVDDLRWTMEQLNKFGEKTKAAGLQLGYHNHTMEFAPQHGVVPFDAMIAAADPKLVTFELDCGWVKVGGGSAVDYLKRYPTRITLLHIKDFKPTDRPADVTNPPPPAELGRGTENYAPIFAAAKAANIKHYFVEQEGFDIPPMEALRIDYEYVNALKA